MAPCLNPTVQQPLQEITQIKPNTRLSHVIFYDFFKYSSTLFSPQKVDIRVSQSVQLLNHAQLFATPWTAACQASLSITNSQSLFKLMSIMSVMTSNPLTLCSLLLLLPSVFPSIRVFSNESVLRIRWPKYWSFSFSISPSNEYSGLISLRIWFDLLAVQGTLKSLLQQHNSKASILITLELSNPILSNPILWNTPRFTKIERLECSRKVIVKEEYIPW